jgi:hypothetical protein
VAPLTIANDDVVTVTFFSTRPNVTDWIGAYSTTANVTTTSPIKFGRCAQQHVGSESEYLTTGTSSLQFNLTNVRSDIVFHYFTNGFHSPQLVLTSTTPVTFHNPNQPLRNRIVPTGDPNVLALTWSSATSVSPTLKWGTSNGTYTYTVPATTRRITKESLCGGVATGVGWHDLGLLHTANVSGILEHQLSSQRIYYIFGDEASNAYSAETVFHVPPAAGMQPSDHHSAAELSRERNTATTAATQPPHSALRSTDSTTTSAPNIANTVTQRGTQVVLMADLGIGASDSSADTEVFSEACIPALNTTKSIGHRVLQVSNHWL